MSKWLGDGYYMFQEIFDWTDMNDKQSQPINVKPGDIVSATVSYSASNRSYAMTMSSGNKRSDYHYELLPGQKETDSVAYFVLEHQVIKCLKF